MALDHVADQGREVDPDRDQVAQDRDRVHDRIRAQDLNRVLERIAQGRGRNLDRDQKAAGALDHDLSRNLDRSHDRKQKRPTYFVKSDRSPQDRDRKRNREVDLEVNLERKNRDRKVEKNLKVDQKVDQKIDRKVEIDQNLKIAEDRDQRAPPG